MTALSVVGLRKGYGGPPVLEGLDLEVEDGELVAVLGPSGCGKTTLLRVVAGFEEAEQGSVGIGGRQVDRLPPERRRVGVVPQEGALFPHLSVGQNVGYGLRRGSGDRVPELLSLVGLGGLGSRRPAELSGGQQQRVALARALATSPSVVLLDEPFSALDAGTRSEMRTEVRRALGAAGASGLLVTHDAVEALATADRVAVLDRGRISQLAAPEELYRAPVSALVARAVGDVVELAGEREGEAVDCVLGRLAVRPAPPGRSVQGGSVQGGSARGGRRQVRVLLRPEQLSLGAGVPAVVTDRAFHGADWLVHVELQGGTSVRVRLRGTAPSVGGRVEVACREPVAVVDDVT